MTTNTGEVLQRHAELVGGLNRPSFPVHDPYPTAAETGDGWQRSKLPRLSYAEAERLLIAGQWVEVVAGSIRELSGRVFQRRGEVVPVVAVELPGGETAVIVESEIQGWAPAEIPDTQ